MSASIPEAFGTRGLGFALAYVAMQVGRPLFAWWAVRHEALARRRNFQRITLWAVLSGIFWIAGGVASPEQRIFWWAAALLIDLAGPWMLFGLPGLGRSTTADWDVDGSHMAERCGLFVIIALGESLLVTGATFAGLEWTPGNWLGFLSALVGSIAMWWIYFDTGAEAGHHRIAHSKDPGRIARKAYTYIHVLIVGGVIVSAVADELALVHPDEASFAGISALLGGPILYLLAMRYSMGQQRPRHAAVVAFAGHLDHPGADPDGLRSPVFTVDPGLHHQLRAGIGGRVGHMALRRRRPEIDP